VFFTFCSLKYSKKNSARYYKCAQIDIKIPVQHYSVLTMVYNSVTSSTFFDFAHRLKFVKTL